MKKAIVLGALLSSTLFLVACSGDKETSKDATKSTAEKVAKKSEEKKIPQNQLSKKRKAILSKRHLSQTLTELCCVATLTQLELHRIK
ncbi:MAG: hypothetical protein ACTIDR_06400 [Pseudolactococcus laudensis]